jgi:hypothetical protein
MTFTKKYYWLFMLIPLFTKCSSYIHIVERTIASFDDRVTYNNKYKSCQNCKFFIENENIEFSRCSKFIKHNHKQKTKYKNNGNLLHYIKANSSNIDTSTMNYYLTTTCRNNENMCGINAKYYERKYHDYY